MSFSYTNPAVPEDYACHTCKVTGCKLWREYGSFGPILLECCDCAGKSQKKDVSEITDEGKIPTTFIDDVYEWVDSIGWRCPAVPCVEGDSYWGYTSVPQPGVDWWKALPTRIGGAVSS